MSGNAHQWIEVMVDEAAPKQPPVSFGTHRCKTLNVGGGTDITIRELPSPDEHANGVECRCKGCGRRWKRSTWSGIPGEWIGWIPTTLWGRLTDRGYRRQRGVS